METPYRAVAFNTNDVLTRAKMDQLATNYQWIKDNTPRNIVFREDEPVVTDLTVIVGGYARINKNKKRDEQKVNVKFPANTFAPDCQPHVTTAVVSGFQRQIFCVCHGLGKKNLPDSTGFSLSVNIAADRKKEDKIKKDFFIHWHAHGYRTEDMAYG